MCHVATSRSFPTIFLEKFCHHIFHAYSFGWLSKVNPSFPLSPPHKVRERVNQQSHNISLTLLYNWSLTSRAINWECPLLSSTSIKKQREKMERKKPNDGVDEWWNESSESPIILVSGHSKKSQTDMFFFKASRSTARKSRNAVV